MFLNLFQTDLNPVIHHQYSKYYTCYQQRFEKFPIYMLYMYFKVLNIRQAENEYNILVLMYNQSYYRHKTYLSIYHHIIHTYIQDNIQHKNEKLCTDAIQYILYVMLKVFHPTGTALHNRYCIYISIQTIVQQSRCT